jgi:hypothetical protein
MSYRGTTIGLYGDTGSGKTTQGGEYAKFVKRTRNQTTTLITSDLGGYASIEPLERAGIMQVIEMDPQADNPWIYIDDAASGKSLKPSDGLVIFDSGTSMGEALLTACSHSNVQIGQQKTQKFAVTQGQGNNQKSLTVAINNEAHYGVVQGFLLDAIWKSTWLTRKGIDVMWTFGLYRSEAQDRKPILGPLLAGKALTPKMPKWFKYTWMIEPIAQDGAAPVHRLYLTAYPQLAGLGQSFGNSRYPLGVDTQLPPYIEPADISKALELIAAGQAEADAKLIEEGLVDA